MKLEELKQQLLKDPDFKKEHERFDLMYSIEMFLIAHNSYGAGSDFGELQGLRRALAVLKNEEFEY